MDSLQQIKIIIQMNSTQTSVDTLIVFLSTHLDNYGLFIKKIE